jgi:hypothetical protein
MSAAQDPGITQVCCLSGCTTRLSPSADQAILLEDLDRRLNLCPISELERAHLDRNSGSLQVSGDLEDVLKERLVWA